MFVRHVVVVENESLLRDLIAKTLEGAGFEVTTAANAADAKRAFSAVDPDAMVIDIELGAGPSGFDLADVVSESNPDLGIVYLTNLPDPRYAGRDSSTVDKRAAYLRKSNLVDSKDLIRALDAVLKAGDLTEFRHDLSSERPLAQLSRNQIAVLKMLADGKTNQQISETRGTTVRAVEGMVSRIFEQLDIDPNAEGNSRVEAARMYLSVLNPTGN